MFESNNNSEYNAMVEAYRKNGADLADSFIGQVRGAVGPTLAVGDVIEWPKEYKVLNITLRTGQKPTQAVIVKVTGEGGDVRYQPFFPSSLGKAIFPAEFDSEGKLVKRLNPIQPNGTAAKFYQSKANLDIDGVMKELMAKGNIKVTAAERKTVATYQTNQQSSTNLYTFDFAA